MTRLIGFRWTCGNVCSREVLIVRGLVIIFFDMKRCKSLHTKAIDGCPLYRNRVVNDSINVSRSPHHHDSVMRRRRHLDTTHEREPEPPVDTLAQQTFLGDDSAEATPLPIPNRAVKLRCADGTQGLPLWQSRSSPGLSLKAPLGS